MTRPPPLVVRDSLSLSPEAKRLFSKREWQRGLKASLIVAGRDFIAGALPKRFTDFAITDLGYHAKKLDKAHGETREQKVRRGLALIRVNGVRARLVAQYCAPWGGWDPTAKEGPPDAVWKAWYQNAVRTGRVRPAKTADGWREARREMRRDVLLQSRLKERLRNYVIDEYVDQDANIAPIPLVETGDLEKSALTRSRPDAKTRGDMCELNIRVPRPHPTKDVVNDVLKQHTAPEAERVADITVREMTAFIRGGRISGKKGDRLKSTSRQKRRIGSLIRGAQVRSARARVHTNRPTKAPAART